MTIRHLAAVFLFLAVLGLGAVGFAAAQSGTPPAATPAGCATPVASPGASPVSSPIATEPATPVGTPRPNGTPNPCPQGPSGPSTPGACIYRCFMGDASAGLGGGEDHH